MIIQPNIDRLSGSAVFQLNDLKFESDFEIEYTSLKAFIKFTFKNNILPLSGGIIFKGLTSDGIAIAGEVDSNNFNFDININSRNNIIIADLVYLNIGEEASLDALKEVKCRLVGLYYSFNISWNFEKYLIELNKSEWSIDDAKRTKKATVAILEGNEIIIKGDDLSKMQVEQLLIDICFLLRPICSSEIFFNHYICNDNLIVFPKSINLKGTLFGFEENILNSTVIWQDLLSNGLKAYRKLDALQKQEYINIGYALSTSAGCGTMETALANLIQTLEYIGNNTSEDIIHQSNPEIKNQIKQIKSNLNDCFVSFHEDNKFNMPESIISGIKNSIYRIQPWNPETIKKVKSLLSKNGWNIKIDFEEFKVIRDGLAHNGMVPKEISHKRRYEIQEQLETILLIHALDIIGLEGRIAQKGFDGWIIYPDKNQVKNDNLN
ncbi:MAG: hypothetical protein KA270_00825 [Saprospiraceae bacterium]|nr:hypothetical protein [Saprospiraceae bacterium]MBP6565672.1 hypothetical protein [Saprospiraceae bacterium]